MSELKKKNQALYKVNEVAIGYNYWLNMLIEKCLGMYVYEGLPKSLPAEQLERNIIKFGYAAVFHNRKANGLVTCSGGLSGVDMYYLPTDFVYSQPVLGSDNLKIHDNVAIIYNTQRDMYNRRGLYPLCQRYARQLADIESSINILIVNQRAGKNNIVADKATALAVDSAMQKLEAGERYTINQNSIIDRYRAESWGDLQTNQLTQLLDARERTLNAFLNEIGVKFVNEKRERLISDEVAAGNQLLITNVDDMLYMRRKGVEEVNNIFGTDIKVYRNPVYTPVSVESEADNGNN